MSFCISLAAELKRYCFSINNKIVVICANLKCNQYFISCAAVRDASRTKNEMQAEPRTPARVNTTICFANSKILCLFWKRLCRLIV